MKIIKILLALFLPPLAVLLERGISLSLLINIVLTVFGVIPGSIHAILVMLDENAVKS